ncbi:MAG: hypothetical protein CVU63_16835, partial [Deltaproteobacteria bacterium HGW-Deltaproteobacteria-20]
GETGGTGGTGETGGTGGTGGTATGGTGGTEVDASVPLKKYGQICSEAEPCEAAYLCVARAEAISPRCTLHCCSALDCDAGSVCVATVLGSTACYEDSATPGDRCCLDLTCGSERACAWEGSGWFCSEQSGNAQSESCDSDAECRSKNCTEYWETFVTTKACMGPCCKDSDCGSVARCDYLVEGSEFRRQCIPLANALLLSSRKPACCSDADCDGKRCVPVEQSTWNTVAGTVTNTVKRVAMRCQ